MKRAIVLWSFPRRWRDRYHDEISHHLAYSTRPIRDRLNLALAAPSIWGDHLIGRLPMTATRLTALCLIVIGLATTAFAIGQLQDGLTELHNHWWSTAATLPLTAGVLLATVTETISRRTPT